MAIFSGKNLFVCLAAGLFAYYQISKQWRKAAVRDEAIKRDFTTAKRIIYQHMPSGEVQIYDVTVAKRGSTTAAERAGRPQKMLVIHTKPDAVPTVVAEARAPPPAPAPPPP